MNIHTLRKHELEDLQDRIANRLKEIDTEERDRVARKKSIKNKTMLKQLTKEDTIFGISFNTDGVPVNMGWCDVQRIEVDEKWPEFYNVNISHKTKPLGVYNHCVELERGDKHYCLFTNCSGPYFFTLKPKTWQLDMAEALEYAVAKMKRYQAKEVKKLKQQVNNCYQNQASIRAINEGIRNGN